MRPKDTSIYMELDDRYYYRGSWFQLIRPMTLTGTITPILVGTSLAAATTSIRYDILLALVVSALLVQAATNIINDYYDFKNGQDQEKWVHSIDKDSTIHGPSHNSLPFVVGTMFVLAAIIGFWIALISSLWVIVAGSLGILAGYVYSAGSHSFSSIGLGEVVAAIFLGPLITILAYTVQGNPLSFQAVMVSLPFTLLIASMILTNNIRDLEKDKEFRNTLAKTLGRAKAVYLLTSLLVLSYFSILLLIAFRLLPWQSSIVLLATPLAGRLIWSFRNGAARKEEVSGMKWAARNHWGFGLLFFIGLWLFG
ncbi:prenyltransferase [Virgibacillus sp. DJP39]|uniref:prenyltransferase n=1 Tax=Virgibacillus sp. DJP39 TaxID=3409790 RepID=UPI003BB5AD46